VPACKSCNRRKATQHWQEWFAAQAFWSIAAEEQVTQWVEDNW